MCLALKRNTYDAKKCRGAFIEKIQDAQTELRRTNLHKSRVTCYKRLQVQRLFNSNLKNAILRSLKQEEISVACNTNDRYKGGASKLFNYLAKANEAFSINTKTYAAMLARISDVFEQYKSKKEKGRELIKYSTISNVFFTILRKTCTELCKLWWSEMWTVWIRELLILFYERSVHSEKDIAKGSIATY